MAHGLRRRGEQELDRFLGIASIDACDFKAVDAVAQAAALTLMAGMVERRFHASQADLAGTVQPCACGQSARFKGCFPRTFRTALGPITLQRAY